jgi:hypothetical protein
MPRDIAVFSTPWYRRTADAGRAIAVAHCRRHHLGSRRSGAPKKRRGCSCHRPVGCSAVAAFALTITFLLQAAPTVQFNAGSESAIRAWSSWVGVWPLLFLGSAGLLCYFPVWAFAGRPRYEWQANPGAPRLIQLLVAVPDA